MIRKGLFSAALPALTLAFYCFAPAPAAHAFIIDGCVGLEVPLYCGNANVFVGEVGTGSAPGGATGGLPPSFASPDPGSFAQMAFGFNLSANAAGSAAPGLLKAFAEAHSFAPSAPGAPTAEAGARAMVAFYDSGTVTSSTLTNGSPVSIKIAVDAAASSAGFAGATVAYSFAIDGSTIIDDKDFSLNTLLPTAHDEIDFVVGVGDTISFSMFLEADATAGRNDFPVGMDAAVDAGHTSHFFLDVLTEGAQFAALSGHDYSFDAIDTPHEPPPDSVPEPMSLPLFGFGLAALAFIRRRVS